jgi:hypothetical protein
VVDSRSREAEERASREAEVRAIREALLEPFAPEEVKWKPQLVRGNRAMAIAYVDARVVQDRLDEVLGVDGWQDECTLLNDGSVVCKLQLRIGGQWITKMDVGSPSEQPDGGDRLKAAFSDALKRAAVKFGVGRYLYRLEHVWVEYDPQRKQIVRPPQLPDEALPRHRRRNPADASRPAPPPQPHPQAPKPTLAVNGAVAGNGAYTDRAEPGKSPPAAPAATPAAPVRQPTPPGKSASQALPKDGVELLERLNRYEAKLVEEGVCRPGELLAYLVEVGQRAGLGQHIADWPIGQFELVTREVKAFVQRRRQSPPPRPPASPPQTTPPTLPPAAVA